MSQRQSFSYPQREPHDSPQLISPKMSLQQAAEIACRVVPDIDAGKLEWYPLCGVIFRVEATRGPARRLDGQLLFAAVDRATGEAFTTEPWPEQAEPLGCSKVQPPRNTADADVSADYRLSLEEAVAAARKAVATALVRRVRLAARFELHFQRVVDPLWKPNWYFVGAKQRVLVDGLTGEFAVVKRG